MSEEREATPTPAAKPAAGSLRVFLNYRREDTADAAGRLHDALAERFGDDRVFMDIDAIEPGVDFADVIAHAVDLSDVFIAMIGERWLTVTDRRGRRRLDDPDDHLRMELEAALERNIRVIPVLVHGVEMPRADELPDALRALSRRQAVELSATRWRYDVGRLTTTLEAVAARAAEERARREAEDEARREADERARREAEERAGREAERQVASGELEIVDKKAIVKDADGVADSAGELGAVAIGGAGSPVRAETPKYIPVVPASEVAERQRIDAERRERPTATREPPPKDASPALARSDRSRWRPWILALAAGALAALLAVLLIPGSQKKPSTTSTGGSSTGGSLTGGSVTGAPLTGGSFAAVPARWQPLSEQLPQAVQAAGVAWFGGRLWVVGGTTGPTHTVLTDVYAYDPKLQKWLGVDNGIPQLRDSRAHAAVVSTGPSLYVIGGFGPDGKAVPTVFRLDQPNGQWRTDPREQLPEARTNGAAAWDGKEIIFAGGSSERPGNDDVWALEPGGVWKPIGKLQQDREDLAAATDGKGAVWFVGGRTTSDPTVASPLVDVVRNNRVTSLPDASPLTGAAAVGVGSGFCTIGGNTKPGNKADFLTDQVRCHGIRARFPTLSMPTNYLGATITGQTIYAVGGYTAKQTAGTTTAEELHIEGG